MTLDVGLAQRLSFVRYIYGVAVEQSRQPEPLAAAAILTFHDAVELFLQLASEHLNVGKPKMDFMQYWDVIDPALQPNRLAQKESMRRLNNARVSLKHHGTHPSPLAIEQFRGSVGSFFRDNTSIVFGENFDDLSLVGFVTCEAARESLRSAISELEDSNTEGAVVSAAIAFEQLKDDVNDRLRARFYRSPFFISQSFTFDKAFFRHRPVHDRQQDDFDDKIVDSIVAIQKVVSALSLGLDYRRYARFQLLAPPVNRTWDGTYHAQIVSGLAGQPKWPPSSESAQFCIDFVIESALRIQEMNIEAFVDS